MSDGNDSAFGAMGYRHRVPWYESEILHDAIWANLKLMDDTQTVRSQNNLRYARLYGNLDIVGLSPTDYFRTAGSGLTLLGSRLTWNVIKSMVDTVTSKIAKNRPKPTFLTNDGDWELQEKAKRLTRFMQGLFYETRAYEKGAVAFRDCGIFGTGFLKIYTENGRIKIERIMAEEIVVDSAEAIYGKPPTMYHRMNVDRHVLLAKYGDTEEKRKAIQAAPERGRESGVSTNGLSDLVEVAEAWHLRSGPKAKDGKHALVIKNCTLFQERYDRDRFPFVDLPWTPPVVGYYGVGLAEELIGLQLEINKLLRQIQLSHHLLSTPKVFLEATSDVVSAHMNNEVGAIVKYRGTMPQVHSFQTVHPEIYQHLDRLYQRAYEIAGISALSAQAKKPAGLESGKALREFSDIESERFAITQQRWEQMYVDITEHCVELARELVESEGGYKVKAPNRRVIEEIDFKDVDLEDSNYILQIFPTNFLSATPSGKLQDTIDLMQSGLIDQEMGRCLLDFPDLEGAMSLLNAAYDDAMLHVSRILNHGEYNAPEEYSNAALSKRLAQASYLKAKTGNCPEERLELLRRYIAACQDLESQASATQAAAASMAAPQVPGQNAPPQAGQLPMPQAAVPGAQYGAV